MRHWSPLDVVIVLLVSLIVVTVGGSWLFGMINGTVLDDVRIKIIETIYNNVMGAILLYVGAKLQEMKEKK